MMKASRPHSTEGRHAGAPEQERVDDGHGEGAEAVETSRYVRVLWTKLAQRADDCLLLAADLVSLREK